MITAAATACTAASTCSRRTTASVDTTLITFDAAMGGAAGTGGASGQGSGGGLYIETGAGVTLSKSSKVRFNFASTSGDDIFGVYTTE